MIEILRLSHRAVRDYRMSTHVSLTARAFGADRLYYTGQKDSKMENSIAKVNEKWGGKFEVIHIDSWKKIINEKKDKGYVICHMTMYGLKANDVIEKLSNNKNKNVLIIVGGEKVPIEIYHEADYNVGVGNQPHSEVAALAVFMHMLTNGQENKIEFDNAKKKIVPLNHGKKIIEL